MGFVLMWLAPDQAGGCELQGSIRVMTGDLADLDSITGLAAQLAELPRLDLLVCNAGQMALRMVDGQVQRTKQGFEMQVRPRLCPEPLLAWSLRRCTPPVLTPHHPVADWHQPHGSRAPHPPAAAQDEGPGTPPHLPWQPVATSAAQHALAGATPAACMPSTLQGTPARVVVLTSTAYWFGAVDLEDLHYQRRTYRPWAAYNQSKLANRLFTLQLAKQLKEEGSVVEVYSVHPGMARFRRMRA